MTYNLARLFNILSLVRSLSRFATSFFSLLFRLLKFLLLFPSSLFSISVHPVGHLRLWDWPTLLGIEFSTTVENSGARCCKRRGEGTQREREERERSALSILGNNEYCFCWKSPAAWFQFFLPLRVSCLGCSFVVLPRKDSRRHQASPSSFTA